MKRDYTVTLRGVAFTSVDIEAESEEEAARLAEKWALGKSQPEQLNSVDYDPQGWNVDECVPQDGER